MSTSKRIARSTAVLSATMALSRILGFIRDLLLARLFGTTVQAEAFVVAFRLPNMLRDLVAEGATTSAVVPVMSWYRAKGSPEEFWHLSQALLVRLSLLVGLLGVSGCLAAPLVVRLIAPGFAEDPEKFRLTVQLTRILFPLIILVGWWAYFMGLLNSLHHFATPALGPALLNVAMIISCLWFVPRVEPGILALAVGVMVGGLLQVLIQLPVAARFGFHFGWRWTHPGAREVVRLFGPRLVGAAVYQASVLLHTALASLSAVVGVGAVAALYYANRLVQLPLALFGVASAQASLPALATLAAHGQTEPFRSTLLSVVRVVAFVVLPAAAGLIALSMPIVSGLFERGAFDHQATVMTVQALSCYALGLLAYSVNKVLTGAFYALQDTWTPVVLAVEALLLNTVLSVALMWWLQIAGLALAAAASNTFNAYRLARRLEQRLGRPLFQPMLASLGIITGASVLMGAACWGAWAAGLSRAPTWVALPAVIVFGLGAYVVLCRWLGVAELATVARRLPLPAWLQRFVTA